MRHFFSLNPLFPGANEVDQASKIHDVLGTPDQSVLQKFKQYAFLLLSSTVYSLMHNKKQNSIFCPSGRSRAMQFNFPPKKGTGISRLIPKCPAPALSLLYQMLAYDPDERITADTALRHTYFREIRCTIKHEAFGTAVAWASTFSLLEWLKRERRPFTDFPGLCTARRAKAPTAPQTTPVGQPESERWRAGTPDSPLCWTWAHIHTAEPDILSEGNL